MADSLGPVVFMLVLGLVTTGLVIGDTSKFGGLDYGDEDFQNVEESLTDEQKNLIDGSPGNDTIVIPLEDRKVAKFLCTFGIGPFANWWASRLCVDKVATPALDFAANKIEDLSNNVPIIGRVLDFLGLIADLFTFNIPGAPKWVRVLIAGPLYIMLGYHSTRLIRGGG